MNRVEKKLELLRLIKESEKRAKGCEKNNYTRQLIAENRRLKALKRELAEL